MISESRKAPRRKTPQSLVVTDELTGQPVGYVKDLSESGMQLEVTAPLTEDAIYQLQFQLDGSALVPALVDAGAHVVWLDADAAQGNRLSGLRFLAISERDLERLRRWAESAHAGDEGS